MNTSTQSLTDRVKGSLFKQARTDGKPLTEEVLAEHFGVSRGTIREVLVTLEQQGLIERRRRVGTMLRKPTLKELVDLWDMRCALEAMAARLAASHFGPADADRLHGYLLARRNAAEEGKWPETDRADIAFHQHIIDLSGNGCIQEVVANTHLYDRIFLFNYSAPSYWPEDEAAGYSHQRIIEALQQHDAAEAAECVARHIQSAKKRKIEALIGRIDPFS